MVTVLFIYYRDFADLVANRKSLLTQADWATQALSDENFRLANLDSLTELPNRRRFFAELASAFNDAERRHVRVAVGIIDLDGFKPINDNYGHSVGDRVLIEAGRRIREVCEGFGPQRVEFARLGGDEFGLVVVRRPRGTIDLVATRANASASGSSCPTNSTPPTRVCPARSASRFIRDSATTVGSAVRMRRLFALPRQASHLRGRYRDLLERARGRDPQPRRHRESVAATADFGAEMDLVFQPIVDAMSEHTAGFEILARWHSPASAWFRRPTSSRPPSASA